MEQSTEEIQNQRVCDFKHAFSGPHGERVLAHLSDFCFENDMTFVENSDISVLREGKRVVILEIKRWMNMDVTKLKE